MATTSITNSKEYPFEPDYAVPPGETLQETIDSLDMDQRDLAVRTGLSTKHINQIIQGHAPITQETAIRFERVTGVPAKLWNSLEINYREQLAKLEEKRQLESDLAWMEKFPIPELIKRGKIESHLEPVLQLRALLSFFGVANVDAWKNVWQSPQVAYRKSAAFKGKPGAIATWIRLGELEAHRIQCKPFDRDTFKAGLDEIRRLTVEPPEIFIPKMKAICANCGVAVALIPEIKGAPVSGAAQWITPEKAIIQLSLRYKTNDQFWFSFFHEAGHILNDGKKEKFIDVGHEKGVVEERADRFATHLLIPEQFVSQLAQVKTTKGVEMFARSVGIAPGIIVGRLQHDKIIAYDQLNKLKLRFEWTNHVESTT
jgi:HTH-type transcriptional regulator / antitoxin HigA